MTPDTKPVFDIGDTYPTTIQIGDRELPLHIKNFTVDELEAFGKKWDACVDTRGTAELSPDQASARGAEQLAFYETIIRENVTLDEGVFKYRGRWILDGAGLLEAFHARIDVLAPLLVKIRTENTTIGGLLKKSNLPRASDSGSAPSSPARGGDEQAPTAIDVGNSNTASSEVATGSSAASESSGETTKVH